MIQILGFNRVLILAVLFLLLSAMAGVDYGYLVPANQKLERNLRTIKSQINQKNNQITEIQGQIEKLNLMREDFDVLRDLGFFDEQKRNELTERLELITELSNIGVAKYTVSSASAEVNENAERAGHVVLRTDMSITLEALDDLDIYKFIYWVENGFPGHTSLKSLDIERVEEITPVNLKKIGRGESFNLLDAKLNFVWRTIVTPEMLENLEGGIE